MSNDNIIVEKNKTSKKGRTILSEKSDADIATDTARKGSVLACVNLHKEYIEANRRLKILSNISLTVERGEQIAVMGRSGSGKTTLLQMLGGLDKPTRGAVYMQGHNLAQLSESELSRLRNQNIGFIYQFHHLLPEFTALENVAVPLLIAKVCPKQARARAEHLLAEVGLGARLQHKPSELSGGERQRVAIARALVNNPKCVLADEPTGNLDDETAAQVFEVMLKLNRAEKTSIILVTHDKELAGRLDRCLQLQAGELV